MTQQEKIEYIAKKIMGWGTDNFNHRGQWVGPGGPFGCGMCWKEEWNPSKDWNHWRQVEEKVMEDRDLFRMYALHVCGQVSTEFVIEGDLERLTEADLPTRIDALIEAHRSLQKP